MRMGPGIIIGLIVIFIGLNILFKDFPFFRVFIGILLITWGISVLIGGFNRHWHWWNRDPNNVVFGESSYNEANAKEYNVVFGKSNYDLRNMVLTDKVKELSIHTVFGSSEILISKTMPVRINANSAFGEVRMPNGNSSAFGSTNYTSSNFRADSAFLDLKIDVAFGSAIVREY